MLSTGATGHREESDSMGPMKVDASKFWGCQTQRSLENFKIGFSIPTHNHLKFTTFYIVSDFLKGIPFRLACLLELYMDLQPSRRLFSANFLHYFF